MAVSHHVSFQQHHIYYKSHLEKKKNRFYFLIEVESVLKDNSKRDVQL